MWPNVILALAFLTFVVVGILTVLLPALSEDPEPEVGEVPTSPLESPSGDTSE